LVIAAKGSPKLNDLVICSTLRTFLSTPSPAGDIFYTWLLPEVSRWIDGGDTSMGLIEEDDGKGPFLVFQRISKSTQYFLRSPIAHQILLSW
jgi:hypothetical protein